MFSEQRAVIQEGLEPCATGHAQVIDEHGRDLGVTEDSLIALGHEAGKCLQTQISEW
jgi:hypothetical protein